MTLSELMTELDAATAAYCHAGVLLREARKAETTTLNRVNEAQKALENYVDGLRQAAPSGSGWANPRERGWPV